MSHASVSAPTACLYVVPDQKREVMIEWFRMHARPGQGRKRFVDLVVVDGAICLEALPHYLSKFFRCPGTSGRLE